MGLGHNAKLSCCLVVVGTIGCIYFLFIVMDVSGKETIFQGFGEYHTRNGSLGDYLFSSTSNVSSELLNTLENQSLHDSVINEDFEEPTKEITSSFWKDHPEFLLNFTNPCWYGSISSTNESLLCLPKVIVAGVTKCGTSELYSLLQLHPKIVPANRKEPMYWAKHLENTPSHIMEYARLFSKATQQILTTISVNRSWFHPLITYDSSPNTFWKARKILRNGTLSRHSAHDIKLLLPDVKIIVTFRNPTARLYSDYNHFNHKSADDFHSRVVRAIRRQKDCRKKYTIRDCAYRIQSRRNTVTLSIGMYDIYTEDWLKIFPREQIYFSKLEEFSLDVSKHMNQMFEFLGVGKLDGSIQEQYTNKRNYTEPMHLKTKTLLDAFYRPHVQRLASILANGKFMWYKD